MILIKPSKTFDGRTAVTKGAALLRIVALVTFSGMSAALAADKVTVGAASTTSDAPIYIADKKGYYREEGLEVTVTNFRSASDMVPHLGTGQLDAVAGSTPIKDPAIYKAITPTGMNPDGRVNMQSLAQDYAFYKEQRLIEGDVKIEQIVDHSFVEAALRELGPYKK
jgi:hypothetical protein